jgi:hypothetical protein
MAFDKMKVVTNEQMIEIYKGIIIAAGSLAMGYNVGGAPIEPKQFEKAYGRAFEAISSVVKQHLTEPSA